MMTERPKAAVIGSGFGGLALAIRLQSGGFDTTLIEKRDKPGGRTYVYEDEGFVLDAGPTVITDPSAIEELFAVAGRSMADYLELLPVSPFYRLEWENGCRFDYVNEQDELDRQIAAKADFRTFFAEAPRLNPARTAVTGVICGVRIEQIENPLMREIRYLDKLIDELAKGRAMEKILRAQPA